MKKSVFALLFLFICFLFCIAGCANPPESVEEIISRSVEAHGGNALTEWETMTIKGTAVMTDGVPYNVEYLLFAQKPDKLRIEHDFTKDSGRRFIIYIYNNDVGWQMRNLIPSYRPEYAKTYKRWLDQCDGIAFYAGHAAFLQKEDTELDGKAAYVIDAVINTDTTELYIDKKNFYLIREKTGNKIREFADFKKFGGAVLASKVKEITITRRGSIEVPITYETVEFNAPIAPELFTEDMPKQNK